MRADRERLEDIRAAIAVIETYGPKSLSQLREDVPAHDVAIRRLQIIGEAVARLSLSLKVRYEAVPWNQIVSMRNTTIHAYHSIDLGVVWEVVDVYLPVLKSTVERMLEEMP